MNPAGNGRWPCNCTACSAHWNDCAGQPWLDTLLTWEETERARRSLERRLCYAHIGRFKPLADFNWSWPKGHSRPTITLGQRNLGQPVALPSGDQASDLRPTVATGMLQVLEQHPAFALAAPRVVKSLEHPADVLVPARCRRRSPRTQSTRWHRETVRSAQSCQSALRSC